MNHFATGVKQNYYGKGDVTVYRLNRDGNAPSGACPVFGANVLMLLYGDAFLATYVTGDNTGLIATDSMKNFIQREAMNFTGYDYESFSRFLAEKFIGLYPQVSGVQLTASEMPYQCLGPGSVAFAPAGPERAMARLELQRGDGGPQVSELTSGISGFRLLRLGGSAFHGFVRDDYTTLPDIRNRPLHMWLDLEWSYTSPEAGFTSGTVTAEVRRLVHHVFSGFESGSIQQIIYQIGKKMLAEIPAIAMVRLEANNRTWDTIGEQGDLLGVYTDARPAYGCLGLTMKR